MLLLEEAILKIKEFIDQKFNVERNILKLFKKEIQSFLELVKNLISSSIFHIISDVKIKLMMEEIKMHYLFLQYDVVFFDDLISYILEIKGLFVQKIEKNRVYKRKPVK